MKIKLLALILMGVLILSSGIAFADCGCPSRAYFTYSIDSSTPHTLQFHDASGCDITYRLWDYGDGKFGIAVNPKHTYATGGIRTIKLSVRDSGMYWTYYSMQIIIP